ncbi:MAG: C-GCAxxG-C-C family (seleno)protein [bacterium]|nr:C-GCAxxG-C-C family (seleno)protein [bacterium]
MGSDHTMQPDLAQRIKDAGNRAESFRKQGFHCSEAVLRGAAAALGITLDALVLRLSSGFRGGGGGYGHRCGALEAGSMLAGLVYGRAEVEEDNSAVSQLVRWLHEQFAREFSSERCEVIKPMAFTQLSEDFSCGPVYRRGAELAAEAIMTAQTLCSACPPFDPHRGRAEEVAVDRVELAAAADRLRALAATNRVRITDRARPAQQRAEVTDADVVFSLSHARRVHPAWGGAYAVEGSKPDRWGLMTVVRVAADADGDTVEVLGIY